MAARVITPVPRLVGALALAVLVAGAMIWIAAAQPSLGLRLGAGPGEAVRVAGAAGPSAAVPQGARIAALAGGGERLALQPGDLLAEPDGLPSFADYETFLERQDRLARIQRAPEVVLEGAGGESWAVAPAPGRALTALPASFWVQIAVGVFSWLIAACVWAFRPQSRAVRYLLLTAGATLVFASFAAVYSTRELGLPEPVFRTLNDLNFFGGTVFSAGLVGLLLYYPRAIAPAWAGLAVLGAYLAWWLAQELGVFESMVVARRIHVMAALLGAFALAAVQWRATRADPVARAALQWLLLSLLICTTIFCVAILLPQLFGVDTSAYQGYAFLLFLLLYAGLGFGVSRFRLFELGRWWTRVVIWTLTVLVLVLLDLAFVVGLQLSGAASLSLALLLCGLIWLPMRAWLWSRFFDAPDASQRAVFENVVSVGFAATEAEQAARWRAVLQTVFAPLEQTPAGEDDPAAGLTEEGLALIVPAAGPLAAQKLRYASRGRRLFGRADEDAAQELTGMLRHVLESRSAYERGVTRERRRIARDIHDNIGAHLLGALHIQGETAKNGRIRETLSDLNLIINDVAAEAADLDEALADLRVETVNRAEAAGIAVDWPIREAGAIRLPAAAVHALRSILREAVSNALKHAAASRLSVAVDCQEGVLALRVTDDGKGFDPATARRGNGLATIAARVQARGGLAEWTTGPDGRGTSLHTTLPLNREPPGDARAAQ